MSFKKFFLSYLFLSILAMNINALNDLFPIVAYGSSSDDESSVEDMDVVAEPTPAECGKLSSSKNICNASALIINML